MKKNTSSASTRVLMICNDQQIDRRILHEAETLTRANCEVIVIGFPRQDLPAYETINGIKIDRVDQAVFTTRRDAYKLIAEDLSDWAKQKKIPPEFLVTPADKKSLTALFLSRVPTPNFGPPWFENWTKKQNWFVRNIVKAVMWPPFRLGVLNKYLSFLGAPVRYALYAPTLLLTPRPLALRWHWWQFRYRLQHVLEKREGQKVLEARVSCREDLNPWEAAVLERGRLYRPDIIHVHDLPQLRPGVFLGEELGVPVIYDAHELFTAYTSLSREERRTLKATERYFIRKANHVIGVNPFLNRVLADDYDIKSPTVILNATTLPINFRKGERTTLLREAMGLSPTDKIILFQGGVLLKERGIADLIEAMALVPDHVHLALMVYCQCLPELKKIIKQAHVEHRVHLVPTVPQEELLWWVASADIGIIPYKPVDQGSLNCSPNKLFEFIAADLPILANDLPYLRHVIVKGGFGMVHTFKKPQDYANGINTMLAKYDGMAAEWRRNILAAQDQYLWSSQEKILLSIYKDLLEPAEESPQACAA